jgi:hypothetical protein
MKQAIAIKWKIEGNFTFVRVVRFAFWRPNNLILASLYFAWPFGFFFGLFTVYKNFVKIY